MVKRKIAAAEIETPLQLKKKKVSVSCSDDNGKLDCSLPVTVIKSMLGDTALDDFMKTQWEKEPLVVKRKDPTFYGNVVSLATMKEVLENNELDFENDVNVSRYVNNEKELLNEVGQITPEDVDRLLKKEQATIQFHHPQRYVDKLWNVLEKLETYFGSLVGSCVYITPRNSQGVAPHCDDVETFVLQLEGSQQWKLYKPMVELSRDYTQDLPQESIGEPTLDVTLDEGDLLYFPRGVIYQCKNVGADGHSTHLSVSTYQQNTWGDFMNHAVQQAIDNALEDDVSTRSGLPVNYLSLLGTGKNMSAYIEDGTDDKDKEKHLNLNDAKVIEFKNTVKSQLAKLVDHIDVNTAADAMCADFFASRLPPYRHIKKEDSEDVLPTLNDKIKIRYPEHVRIIYDDDEENDENEDGENEDSEDEEMEDEKPSKSKTAEPKSPKANKKVVNKTSNGDDDDEEDDEDADVTDIQPHIKIIHSLENDRFWHMGGGIFETEENGCIRLHVSFAKAAIELLNNSDNYIAVKELLMDDDDDKLTLATLLFENDLVEVEAV